MVVFLFMLVLLIYLKIINNAEGAWNNSYCDKTANPCINHPKLQPLGCRNESLILNHGGHTYNIKSVNRVLYGKHKKCQGYTKPDPHCVEFGEQTCGQIKYHLQVNCQGDPVHFDEVKEGITCTHND